MVRGRRCREEAAASRSLVQGGGAGLRCRVEVQGAGAGWSFWRLYFLFFCCIFYKRDLKYSGVTMGTPAARQFTTCRLVVVVEVVVFAMVVEEVVVLVEE